jgi:hypothetical protein
MTWSHGYLITQASIAHANQVAAAVEAAELARDGGQAPEVGDGQGDEG